MKLQVTHSHFHGRVQLHSIKYRDWNRTEIKIRIDWSYSRRCLIHDQSKFKYKLNLNIRIK